MGAKVNFDPINKIVEVTEVPVEEYSGGDYVVDLDIQVDVYSDGKEDWRTGVNNCDKYRFPVRAVGGQDLPGERLLGSTFFLDYGWRIRPYEGSHVLRINGNLYTDTGDSPFTQTVGTYNVMVIQQVSSLVDSTVAQLAEIEYASFSGGVTVDVVNGSSGTEYPSGTAQDPVNNFSDALTIASTRGFTTFYVIGDATVDDSLDFRGYIFVGESQTKSEITVDPNAQVDGCEFMDAAVVGTLDGDAKLKNCTLSNLSYINGVIEQCLLETGTITLGGGAEAHFLDCWSGVAGTSTPIIDMGGSGQELSVRNYNGGIELRNKSGSDPVSMDINSGHVILHSTVTNGDIVVRGIGKLTDNSVGANVVIQDYVNPSTVADQVWEENASEHVGSGTMGEALDQASQGGDLTGIALEATSQTIKSGVDALPTLAEIEASSVLAKQAELIRALGLAQENYYMDNTSYTLASGQYLLNSARLRLYSVAGSVGTDNDVIATYTITANWTGLQLTNYAVAKQ